MILFGIGKGFSYLKGINLKSYNPMKIQWTIIYVCVSLILLSCTENEPPKIIDYEKALTTLYTKEFTPPFGLG